MKTYELSIKQVIVATALLISLPAFGAWLIGMAMGWEVGYNTALRQVMQTKNSDQFDRLSPDVKSALSQMEKIKISATSIAGAGAQGERR